MAALVKTLVEVQLVAEGVAARVVCLLEVTASGREETVPCDGLFVAIGLIPENGPFASLADLNPWGYFDSDEGCCTKTPGVFVAGDCRSKRIRQLTTAAADGAVAALAACRYINESL